MIASFKTKKLNGTISAPPSKSLAHRYLIGAALSGCKCTFYGVDYSEDILASIDCLKGLGAKITKDNDRVEIDSANFLKVKEPILECRESGSTLRFLIPLALMTGEKVVLKGSDRLFERPLDVYREICQDKGFVFEEGKNSIRVKGRLEGGNYKIRGNVSSQFITGMIFALAKSSKESSIEIIPPFESRPYVNLTLCALQSFGADVRFVEEYKIVIKPSKMKSFSARIEGDYSNSAFLEAFNYIGSSVKIENLNPDSLQGDKVYVDYFKQISEGRPTLDISDCPDLGPVLIALASLKNGAIFIGTDRLKAKESDRGNAMHQELVKLGGGLVFGDNSITVPKQKLQYKGEPIDGHNDHRIVMAMSVILSQTGGEIRGAEAVRKSYPGFFENIRKLGAEVEVK